MKNEFTSLVEGVFNKFILLNNLIVFRRDYNYISYKVDGYAIIISYDEIENELYIDFDLTGFAKIKESSNGLEFPVFLNLNMVADYFGIETSSDTIDKALILEQRILLKYGLFVIIWGRISQLRNYKETLASILISERIKNHELNKFDNYKSDIDRAHNFFKRHQYKESFELLALHKDKLNKYDKKLLDYSIKKLNIDMTEM